MRDRTAHIAEHFTADGTCKCFCLQCWSFPDDGPLQRICTCPDGCTGGTECDNPKHKRKGRK